MNNEEYFNYMMETFHEEHDLISVVLIGKDHAVKLIGRDRETWEEKKNE